MPPKATALALYLAAAKSITCNRAVRRNGTGKSAPPAYKKSLACQHPDNPHQDALRHLQHWLQHHFADTPLTAVVHRVVHGGDYFDRAVLVNDDVMAKLASLNRLALLAPAAQPSRDCPLSGSL